MAIRSSKSSERCNARDDLVVGIDDRQIREVLRQETSRRGKARVGYARVAK